MKRYALKVGEHYAIKTSSIERDSDGFFILMGGEPRPNDAVGSAARVYVRGALSQFDGEGGDSYEAIGARVEAAAATKPSCVVLDIHSPGGAVAGLYELVLRLQRLRTACGIPFVAQINELAASAAFGIACACDRRFAPPSGIAGSIGTISTMVSMARRDEREGIDVVLITSGARKADGNPHQPLVEAAVRAERARNGQLAEQFYSIAAKALRVSPRRIESLEGGIGIGPTARKMGLINAIRGIDATLAAVGGTVAVAQPA